MNNHSTVVGMDVHKAMIVAAALPAGSDQITQRLTIENQPKAIAKMVERFAANGSAEFVYEAGPCGYEVQRQIAGMGHKCVVIAPSLTPVRPGDRVKTDRRDAEKLARFYRAGELTVIHVPTREGEASRDLVRGREDTLEDRLRARHRMSKFLLRQGRVYQQTKAWGVAHRAWLKAQRFEWAPLQQTFEAYVRTLEEAEARLKVLDQQIVDMAQSKAYKTQVQYFRCFKGIDTLSAITLMVETQEFRRFDGARSFMCYTGMVASEHTSVKVKRGGITKAGNAHIRRVLVEAAWSYRNKNTVSKELAARREGCPPEIVQIARKAQDRLHRKFWRMISRNKPHQVTVIAVARELAGFIWSIGQRFPVAAA